jgi:hypothetical protein
LSNVTNIYSFARWGSTVDEHSTTEFEDVGSNPAAFQSAVRETIEEKSKIKYTIPCPCFIKLTAKSPLFSLAISVGQHRVHQVMTLQNPFFRLA